MSITYKLDGKEISPKDLTGKSGKLEMTINYENKSKQNVDVDGQQTEMYTPFTLATNNDASRQMSIRMSQSIMGKSYLTEIKISL